MTTSPHLAKLRTLPVFMHSKTIATSTPPLRINFKLQSAKLHKSNVNRKPKASVKSNLSDVNPLISKTLRHCTAHLEYLIVVILRLL